MANNQNTQSILNKIYSILKFSDKEARGALNDLANIQQVAAATELFKVLTKEEIETLNGLAQKSSEERNAEMEKLVKNHVVDNNLQSSMQAAAKKAIDEHIAYLKTRGDDNQKKEIAKLLAQIS